MSALPSYYETCRACETKIDARATKFVIAVVSDPEASAVPPIAETTIWCYPCYARLQQLAKNRQ